MKVLTTNTVEKEKTTDYFRFFRKIKRDHFIFFMCIVIASLFWLLIKLSEVYTVTYVFNVNYNHVPVKKRLTSLVDSSLTADVTARGFELINMGFGKETITLSIDLRKYQLIHDKGTSYYIYTQELRKRLAEQLRVEESNILFSENRVAFVLEDLKSKKVSVVPRYTIHFKDEFGAYLDARVVPDQVEVFGPATALDTLSSVYTRESIFNDIESDIKASLLLENKHPDIFNYSISKVSLDVDVERFTESSLVVPINQYAGSIPIKTFPSSVKILYKVAQIDFNKVQVSQFNVSFDLREINLKEATKLHLIVDKQPASVSSIRMEPVDVEFLIIK